MSETTTNRADRGRPARPQAVLAVLGREQLSPHTVRITAGGPGFEALRMNEFTDKYAKILFVDPALGLTPPYDLAALRESLPPAQQPVTRTYTLRRADPRRQEVTIDFVVHGDEGIAAPWAARAEPGDVLTMSGPAAPTVPIPPATGTCWPATSRPCPPSAPRLRRCRTTRAGWPTWRRPTRASTSTRSRRPGWRSSGCTGRIPGASPSCWPARCWPGPWLPGRADVFAHGERDSMKAIRAALKTRLGDGDQVSLSGYWAAGRTEDVFQSEKRQPIGQI